jgi:hypothetical protein
MIRVPKLLRPIVATLLLAAAAPASVAILIEDL